MDQRFNVQPFSKLKPTAMCHNRNQLDLDVIREEKICIIKTFARQQS